MAQFDVCHPVGFAKFTPTSLLLTTPVSCWCVSAQRSNITYVCLLPGPVFVAWPHMYLHLVRYKRTRTCSVCPRLLVLPPLLLGTFIKRDRLAEVAAAIDPDPGPSDEIHA